MGRPKINSAKNLHRTEPTDTFAVGTLWVSSKGYTWQKITDTKWKCIKSQG